MTTKHRCMWLTLILGAAVLIASCASQSVRPPSEFHIYSQLDPNRPTVRVLVKTETWWSWIKRYTWQVFPAPDMGPYITRYPAKPTWWAK